MWTKAIKIAQNDHVGCVFNELVCELTSSECLEGLELTMNPSMQSIEHMAHMWRKSNSAHKREKYRKGYKGNLLAFKLG